LARIGNRRDDEAITSNRGIKIMRHIFHNQARRRGAVVPLFALLVVPLMGMLAFSIDLGYIALVATDLQTAADSAALAGAEQMQQYYVQYTLPGQSHQQSILSAATGSGAGGPMATAQTFA